MKGIDISAWQGNVNWQTIKDANIEFVLIKLGQGNSLDEKFVDDINNAIANNLKVGIYYYSMATTVWQAQNEADWVDTQIKQYLNSVSPEMGVWYDMEDQSILDSGADITALCKAFTAQLPGAGVYSSYDWLTNHIKADELDVPIWCAQYNSECDFQHPKLKIWQFTDSLKIAGTDFDGDTLLS